MDSASLFNVKVLKVDYANWIWTMLTFPRTKSSSSPEVPRALGA